MKSFKSKKATRRLAAALMVSVAPFVAVAPTQAQTTVNPVQTSTFTLAPAQNPIIFGANTNIDTTAATPVDRTANAVSGGTGTAWDVTNQGSIQGNNRGVSLDGARSTLTNSGTISATSTLVGSAGVFLSNGGTVTNQATGTIKGIGTDGIGTNGAAGTVTNAGTITSDAATAIFLRQNGSVTNQASGKINGFFFGVLATGLPTGSITNAGSITATNTTGVGVSGLFDSVINKTSATISGTDTGVNLTASNVTIQNDANATISGGNVGISASGSITNAGTITGGTGTGKGAVVFTGGAGATNTLTLQTGSVLTGDAVGSTAGAANKLVLQGHGTISNNFLNFNTLDVQADSVWSWSPLISGPTLTISGGTTISSGTLEVTELELKSAVTVKANGTLRGDTQVIGDITVQSNGAVVPGSTARPLSGLQVAGNISFANNSVLQVNVNAAGRASAVHVNPSPNGSGGTATLGTGSRVVVLAQTGTYALSTKYSILSATGGVTGTFTGGVTTDSAFLKPTLSYDANDVFLTLDLISAGNGGGGGSGNNGFASAAQTRNQTAVAGALDASPTNSGLIKALLSQSADGARIAFDALSGELFGTVHNTQAQEGSFARTAILGRLRQASYADAPDELGALGYAGPELAYAGEGGNAAYAAADANGSMSMKAPRGNYNGGRNLTFWAQGLGGWGHSDSDGNAASLKSRFGGFLSGADMRIGQAWRAGLVAGYTRTDLNVDARASSAGIDSVQFGAYAGGRLGAFNVRTGGSLSYDSIDTSRSVAFPGLTDSAHARFHGSVGQLFGEVGHGFALGHLALEPFAGLAYVHVHDGSFQESGGLAALSAGSSTEHLGYSTLGLRAAAAMPLANGTVLIPRGSVQWQHAFGNVTPTTGLAFQSTGTAFTVAGIPIARNAALVEGGFDWRISPWVKLGAFYQGELAAHAQAHAVKGAFTWDF